MIPISFSNGLAPYSATMKLAPAGYVDANNYLNNPQPKTSAGQLNFEGLSEGTYAFDLKDACGTTVDVSYTLTKVSSDVPTSAMSIYSYGVTTPACKGISSYLSMVSSAHELYPYLSNLTLASTYYEMVLTEKAT
jgi:hypothetical protein